MITENIPGRSGFSSSRAFQRRPRNCRSPSGSRANNFFVGSDADAQSSCIPTHNTHRRIVSFVPFVPFVFRCVPFKSRYVSIVCVICDVCDQVCAVCAVLHT